MLLPEFTSHVQYWQYNSSRISINIALWTNCWAAAGFTYMMLRILIGCNRELWATHGKKSKISLQLFENSKILFQKPKHLVLLKSLEFPANGSQQQTNVICIEYKKLYMNRWPTIVTLSSPKSWGRHYLCDVRWHIWTPNPKWYHAQGQSILVCRLAINFQIQTKITSTVFTSGMIVITAAPQRSSNMRMRSWFRK